VANVAGPAHLADVHQTFDARLQLDERAVVRDRPCPAPACRPGTSRRRPSTDTGAAA
jgi:hypothetical protein